MEQKLNNNEVEIDLKELFTVLMGKIWIILIVGIGLALIAFSISTFVLTPRYQSTTKIYILNQQDDSANITYSDLQTGSQLTKDYMTLVISRPVIDQVITELSLDLSYESLVGMISTANPADTRILSITVEYPDPFVAKKIADAVREAAATHITTVMNIDQISLVEEANIPENSTSPNVNMNTMIGGVLGLMIAAFIVLIFHMTNDKIKTPDDVERYLGLSTLCSIPVDDDNKKDKVKNRRKSKNPKLK